MQIPITNRTTLTRICAVGLLLAVCAAVPLVSSLAQRRSSEKPPKVTGISSRKVGSGEVISLSADKALNGIQTWQDPNGSFHLILPGSGDSAVSSSLKGVKVRRVGNSLEVEIQAKRGSSVTVEPRFNRLDLVVSGGVESQGPSAVTESKSAVVSSPRNENVSRSLSLNNPGAVREKSSKKGIAPLVDPSLNPLPSSPVETAGATAPPATAPGAEVPSVVPVTEPNESEQASDVVESSFLVRSGWWVSLLMVAGLIGFVLWRRHDKSGWEEIEEPAPAVVGGVLDPQEANANTGERRNVRRRREGRAGGNRSSDRKAPMLVRDGFDAPLQQSLEPRPPANVPAPAGLFGAYRVDQEVGKLVLGQAHRMDVLTSRGPDDRRAMETSLLKALRSNETDDEGRRKARQALEEYGFVARQSATVLLGHEACDRAAAAKFLGEVGLPSSLQFLLEALYDTDTIVRTQAVESIGALKLPSAIGALLDIARRYPDVSSSALSNALNACSIDSLDFFDSPSSQSSAYLTGGEPFTSEIKHLEPAAAYRELPDSSDDEDLVDILARLQSTDVDVRATAAQSLAIFRNQRSVAALRELTSTDAEPAVRAAAVGSLGAIDHESVFSSVLVALSDEARDVRAAAARAVSRLSFDRADAYARVIEVSDKQELTDVARACIKTGLASQALDRLSSEDRRQAYEAYSVLSLLVKAGECQPILEMIEKHADVKTCSSAIQILGMADQPDTASQLRLFAVREGMPERLRTELMEVVYKLDQLQPA